MVYRRSYERFILNDSASVVTKEGEEKSLLVKDLSARGIGVIGDSAFGINEKVTMVINVPFFFDRPISKQAKVVWCKKIDQNLWQAGLVFGLDKIDFI